MALISTDKKRIVIGLGKTGFSVVQFLANKGLPVAAMDTRENPPYAQHMREQFPAVPVVLGGLDQAMLNSAAEIIVSPGLSLETPELQAAKNAGVRLVGDIQLFADLAKAPIVAITGSNAKSTVTTLVGEMAKNAGIRVGVGGNLGTPALDLLDDSCELYVLELSSFQLETTDKLNAKVATVLNVSPDHLDRYNNSMLEYHKAKHRIFFGCQQAVVNKDDSLSEPMLAKGMSFVKFGLGKPDLKDFGVNEHQGEAWLFKGLTPLMACKEIRIKGLHNRANALAALALGDLAGIDMSAMLQTLRAFSGLPHRCEWVREIDGVAYFNDSKGTNVGAAEAALKGLGGDISGKVILIAGGEGKGADFTYLKNAVAEFVSHLVLIGTDAPLIQAALQDVVPCHSVGSDFDAAIAKARSLTKAGDAVLLSPACASFDMFKNFEDRGEQFAQKVKAL
ncbi:MAG: UDP-N-acetylmuramoyl-L-alanine--D-glutamate ligase [Oceanospirillaceae bacterium]|nr:UDP-N-acetylmuramoyl-L-alanine--D-glutamate ligase [Oceanospirillaceae bacterium]MCP5351097.1 UDP-N-acetylmuramoyl-L-alanine--D-glutamate ligase [Oceanospirillaceae bacterium]